MKIKYSAEQSDVTIIESVTSDTVINEDQQQNNLCTNQTITNIRIDFSDVLRSSFEVFKMAYDLGRNSLYCLQEPINKSPV